jgi:hypothetical protein
VGAVVRSWVLHQISHYKGCERSLPACSWPGQAHAGCCPQHSRHAEPLHCVGTFLVVLS